MTLDHCHFRLQLQGIARSSLPGISGKVTLGADSTIDMEQFSTPPIGIHVIRISGITDTVNPILNLADLVVTADGATVTNGDGKNLVDGQAIEVDRIHFISVRRIDGNAGFMSCTGSGDIFPSLGSHTGFAKFTEDTAGTDIDVVETITFANNGSAECSVEIVIAYA
ncbi:hypothetical protein HNR46_001340 [Haloferula luteola]|uniref:Uncharacterized protein n=1 Tax=Haloferula luteola TaxID=595692 RepID=A0A840V228_9BACT|nr:hypothetical protein [Haloferula luteola]MBB5351106.1 hypothetical protein [Haloferula luteola]